MSHYITYDTHGLRPASKASKKHHSSTGIQTELINLNSYSVYPLVQKLRTLEVILHIHDRWVNNIENIYRDKNHSYDERSELTNIYEERVGNYKTAIALAYADMRLIVDTGLQRVYKERLEAVEWSLDVYDTIFHDSVDVGLIVKLNYCLGAAITQAARA